MTSYQHKLTDEQISKVVLLVASFCSASPGDDLAKGAGPILADVVRSRLAPGPLILAHAQVGMGTYVQKEALVAEIALALRKLPWAILHDHIGPYQQRGADGRASEGVQGEELHGVRAATPPAPGQQQTVVIGSVNGGQGGIHLVGTAADEGHADGSGAPPGDPVNKPPLRRSARARARAGKDKA